MTDERRLEETWKRHYPPYHLDRSSLDPKCVTCGQEYPCDTAYLLERLERAKAENETLRENARMAAEVLVSVEMERMERIGRIAELKAQVAAYGRAFSGDPSDVVSQNVQLRMLLADARKLMEPSGIPDEMWVRLKRAGEADRLEADLSATRTRLEAAKVHIANLLEFLRDGSNNVPGDTPNQVRAWLRGEPVVESPRKESSR